MNMQDIRAIAKDMGIKTSRITKVNLVRMIQLQEGNFGCFATAHAGDCDQTDCMWRDDCLTLSVKQVTS